MKAQDGKVYKNIATGEILGNEIWLGCNDSEGNYIVLADILRQPSIPHIYTILYQTHGLLEHLCRKLKVDLVVLNMAVKYIV